MKRIRAQRPGALLLDGGDTWHGSGVALWTKGQDGVRSLGEPPTIPTAGAVACAVFNAIGAPIRSLPLTPDKVLAAVELAAKGGA